MTKKLFMALLLVFSSLMGISQTAKYAYVDTEYILGKLPEYEEAQKKLNEMSEGWEKESKEKYSEVEKLEKAYAQEKILLPEAERKKREEEILKKRTEAMEFQRVKFGVNGELFTERQKLIKPIQEKLYKAIKEVAESGGFTFVFDIAGQSNLLYADPKQNKSDLVLKKLGQ
jgi:outer membrane protein